MDSNNPGDPGFHSLNEDLMSNLCKLIGANFIMTAIGGCSKLHRVWQRTVHKLDTKEEPLTEKDIETIKRYKNLNHIVLHSSHASHGFPIAAVITGVLPSLAMLESVSVSGRGAFDALYAMASISMASKKLTELHISDKDHILSAVALLAAASLTTVTSLSLECSKLDGPASALRETASAFTTSLTDFSLITMEDVDELDRLAAIPGAMTALQGLTLLLAPATWASRSC